MSLTPISNENCRLRVLYVLPGRSEGHNMVFARNAAEALRQYGIEVLEFYVHSRTAPLEVQRELLRLRQEIRNFDPKIVHAQYGGVTGLLTALAAGRRPMVLSVRGSDLNLVPSINAFRNRATRLMTRLSALRAQAVVCVSEALARQLWVVCGKTVVIASGVDTDIFYPTDRLAARALVNWSADESFLLINAGQAPEQKGLPMVEAAVEMLRARGLQVRLHVIRGELTRAEVAVLMNAADCLVLASQTEGSPNIVKEALACNMPVVSVPVGDVVERLQGITPGCVVQRTPESLAEGIAEVLREPRRSNGAEALRAQGLSLVHTTEALCGVYHRVYSKAER